MKIYVKIKTKAKETRVEQIDDTHFVVRVKEPPIEGRANWAIERTLAGHFGVPISRVRIVSGHTGREKVIEIG